MLKLPNCKLWYSGVKNAFLCSPGFYVMHSYNSKVSLAFNKSSRVPWHRASRVPFKLVYKTPNFVTASGTKWKCFPLCNCSWDAPHRVPCLQGSLTPADGSESVLMDSVSTCFYAGGKSSTKPLLSTLITTSVSVWDAFLLWIGVTPSCNKPQETDGLFPSRVQGGFPSMTPMCQCWTVFPGLSCLWSSWLPFSLPIDGFHSLKPALREPRSSPPASSWGCPHANASCSILPDNRKGAREEAFTVRCHQ